MVSYFYQVRFSDVQRKKYLNFFQFETTGNQLVAIGREKSVKKVKK